MLRSTLIWWMLDGPPTRHYVVDLQDSLIRQYLATINNLDCARHLVRIQKKSTCDAMAFNTLQKYIF